MLESMGSKGSVQVNGTVVKKNTSCVLKSGDEVVFGLPRNHAYVSFYMSGVPTLHLIFINSCILLHLCLPGLCP